MKEQEKEMAEAKEEKPAKKEKAEKVEEPAQMAIEVEGEVAGDFVASKTGKKYYAADSAAGKKIKEENRVYFKTEKEAEAAGFSA